MNHQELLQLIASVRERYECNFCHGDCGHFARALAHFLGLEQCEFLVECGTHPEMYDHVAVKYRGHVYDGKGEATMPTSGSVQYDDFNKRDYTVQVIPYLATDSSARQDILRFTDNSGYFACGVGWKKLLTTMRSLQPCLV